MHVIYGETINDVIMKLLEKVLNEGVRISTRNGDAITIYDVSMILRNPREGANKQVISSQADSLIKISRIWADFFPANTSNQPI